MSYDSQLASRVRASVDGAVKRGEVVTEKQMFGGVAWMLGGHMFVGIVDAELMVRVGKDAHDDAVSKPHARIMDFTGKPMRGYVFVAPAGLKTDAAIGEWIARGATFVRTLPAKPPASKKPARRAPKGRDPR